MPFLSLHDGQAPQAGLAAPKRPQPRVDFVDIAAPSSVHCRRVCAAKGEAGILALGEHVRDRRSRVTSQKQRDKGDLPKPVYYLFIMIYTMINIVYSAIYYAFMYTIGAVRPWGNT